MLKINRKVEYGLMAVKYLHQLGPDRTASARDIAESSGAPFDLLSKVLQRLHAVGLVRSTQGIRGGYALNRELNAINMAEFVEALEGPIAVTICTSKSKVEACEMASTCNIMLPMAELNSRLNATLAGMSLAEVTHVG